MTVLQSIVFTVKHAHSKASRHFRMKQVWAKGGSYLYSWCLQQQLRITFPEPYCHCCQEVLLFRIKCIGTLDAPGFSYYALEFLIHQILIWILCFMTNWRISALHFVIKEYHIDNTFYSNALACFSFYLFESIYYSCFEFFVSQIQYQDTLGTTFYCVFWVFLISLHAY